MMLPAEVPELVDLHLLLCVEQLGSLSKAARAHSVSQPTASVRIQALERRLGLRLLERSPTGCRLTPAGQMVAQWARTVVDAAFELATRTAALRDTQHGRLRVTASLTVADYLMPYWLIELRKRMPQVAVELQVYSSRDVTRQVMAGHTDLGFVEDSCLHRDLVQTAVGRDELVVVVAPFHPWASRTAPVGQAELAAGPLVLREQGSGARETLERALGGLDGHYPHLELGSTTAIKAAVGAGAGAAVLSMMSVEQELQTGQLCEVPVVGVDLVQDLRGVWRENADLSPPAKELIKIASQGAPRDRGRVNRNERSQPADQARACVSPSPGRPRVVSATEPRITRGAA